MAVVRAFPAVRYDVDRVGDLRDVIAPPYDVISPAQQEALYARHPANVIRLILGRETNRAEAAAATLADWLRRGILRQDPTPAIYRYAQTFTLAEGRRHTREGVLCRLRVEDFSSGIVRPHERTLPGPKADRLAVLRATGAHLSPIFALYSRPGERLADLLGAGAAPDVDLIEANGERSRLWRIADAAAIARFEAAIAPETLFIADGHHRYETALAYAKERDHAGASSYVLAYLSNMEEDLVILPTHRLVRPPMRLAADALVAGVAEMFHTEPLPEGPRPSGVIDLVLPGRGLRLRPKPEARACLQYLAPTLRGLDVALLHGAILEPLLGVDGPALEFTHEDAEAIAAVASGRAAAAFLLNPPSIGEVRTVCLAGELMPEKSTYFYPKLASGFVFDLVGPPWM